MNLKKELDRFLKDDPALLGIKEEMSALKTIIAKASGKKHVPPEKETQEQVKLSELNKVVQAIKKELTQLGEIENPKNENVVNCFSRCCNIAKDASSSIKKDRKLWTMITDFMASIGNWLLDKSQELQDKWNKQKTPQRPLYFSESTKSTQDMERSLQHASDDFQKLIMQSLEKLKKERGAPSDVAPGTMFSAKGTETENDSGEEDDEEEEDEQKKDTSDPSPPSSNPPQ